LPMINVFKAYPAPKGSYRLSFYTGSKGEDMTVAIIDYGMGNLRSVQKSLEYVGCKTVITSEPDTIRTASGVVLPGVGAFADAIANLSKQDLRDVIKDVITTGKPFLGICLGLQLLFEYSEENGLYEGLKIFKGGVKKLSTGLKIPHMGWNQLDIKMKTPILEGVKNKTAYYFVHSYHVVPEENIIAAIIDYGQEVVAVIARENVFGIQFHPEKSSKAGLGILRNYRRLVEK
jgi:glutamine amidotransferase